MTWSGVWKVNGRHTHLFHGTNIVYHLFTISLHLHTHPLCSINLHFHSLGGLFSIIFNILGVVFCLTGCNPSRSRCLRQLLNLVCELLDYSIERLSILAGKMASISAYFCLEVYLKSRGGGCWSERSVDADAVRAGSCSGKWCWSFLFFWLLECFFWTLDSDLLLTLLPLKPPLFGGGGGGSDSSILPVIGEMR